MKKEERLYEQMQNNASEKDVDRIRENIDGMNRGPIAKIWDKVMALWKFVQDPNAPWAGKVIAIGALIYLISPIDAIPDIIPGLGLTDDVSIIGLAVAKLAVDLQKYMKNNQ